MNITRINIHIRIIDKNCNKKELVRLPRTKIQIDKISANKSVIHNTGLTGLKIKKMAVAIPIGIEIKASHSHFEIINPFIKSGPTENPVTKHRMIPIKLKIFFNLRYFTKTISLYFK